MRRLERKLNGNCDHVTSLSHSNVQGLLVAPNTCKVGVGAPKLAQVVGVATHCSDSSLYPGGFSRGLL